MKVMCDTNIILDVLLEREPFVEDSYKLLRLCEEHDINGFVSASSITDIFYIVKLIDAEENPYKIWVEFFKNLPEWNDQEGYILDFFKSNFLFTEQRLEILENYFAGKYNEIIKWYELQDSEKEFIEIIKSEDFRKRIFNNEPIERETKELFNGEEFTIVSINDDVCRYQKLITLLQKKDFFPVDWISAVENRMKEIKEKEENLLEFVQSRRKRENSKAE